MVMALQGAFSKQIYFLFLVFNFLFCFLLFRTNRRLHFSSPDFSISKVPLYWGFVSWPFWAVLQGNHSHFWELGPDWSELSYRLLGVGVHICSLKVYFITFRFHFIDFSSYAQFSVHILFPIQFCHFTDFVILQLILLFPWPKLY